jgi:hypothetical protein
LIQMQITNQRQTDPEVTMLLAEFKAQKEKES